MKTESGEFICKAQGLLLEGMILAYDPVNDELDWIPIEGCMGDLSQAAVTSTKEPSELVLQPWEWKVHRTPQVKRGKEEGTESSPPTDDNKTDDGTISRESPTDSAGSCATSSVSTSEEEQGTDSGHVADQELVSESSHKEEKTTKEPMDEEAPLDTESEGSAVTDNTLGRIAPSSQEVVLLEGLLDLGHLAGGDSRAEQASVRCGGPDTPKVGGDATHMVHKKQREDQELNPLPLHVLHEQSQMGG